MNGPKKLKCNVCGNQLLAGLLQHHVTKCKQQQKLIDQQKPSQVRQQQNDKTKAEELKSTITVCFQQCIEQSQTVMQKKKFEICSNCQNRIPKEDINDHIEECWTTQRAMKTVNIQFEEKKKIKEKKPPAFVSRPRTLICYICGKEYGTASLQIHLKTCIKKWETEESYKPYHLRKPVPQPPKNFDQMIQGAKNGDYMASLEIYNDEAFKNYNDNLEPCRNCGRTFLPDRLVVHLRSCDKDFARKHKKEQLLSQFGVQSTTFPAIQNSQRKTQQVLSSLSTNVVQRPYKYEL